MQADLFSADRVKTLLAIVDQGSFSRASVALGVTQSSISHQIARMEKETGRKFFDRSARKVALTVDGEAFLLFAKAMASIGENGRRYFMQPRVEGRLRVGVSEEFARTYLTRVLALFFLQFPNFQLELSCDASASLLMDLEEGRYDLVLANRTSRQSSDTLRRVHLRWAGRESFTLPIGDPVPLVVSPSREPTREIALNALRENGRTWRIIFESSNLSAQMAAAEAGLGVCVVGEPIPLQGVVLLEGGRVGLPSLPDHDIVLVSRDPPETKEAGTRMMTTIIRSIFAELSPIDFPRP